MTTQATAGRYAMLVAVAVLAACAAPITPVPITPPADVKDAAVARRPVEPPLPPSAPVPPVASQSVTVPAGAQYVCVASIRGQTTQTTIEFAPKVAALCKRHPEMGPCQYERDLCRSSGGRVYAAGGQEITRQIEDEYDRKVLRVRFRAN